MKPKKEREDLNMDSGQRMDTMGIDDDDSYGSDGGKGRYDLADEDKLSVNLDDVVDDDDDVIDLSKEGPEEETKVNSSNNSSDD